MLRWRLRRRLSPVQVCSRHGASWKLDEASGVASPAAATACTTAGNITTTGAPPSSAQKGGEMFITLLDRPVLT